MAVEGSSRPTAAPTEGPAVPWLFRTAELEGRIEALERQPDLTDALLQLDADVVQLRNDVHRELSVADDRLAGLLDRLVLLEEAVNAVGTLAAGGSEVALTEENEEYWVARAADGELGERFSALVVLGRGTGELPLQASLERVRDAEEDALVVWQALQNLGRFAERATAPDVAARLSDSDPVIREAAIQALEALGAPAGDFDPLAPPEEREAAAARLRRWAEQID